MISAGLSPPLSVSPDGNPILLSFQARFGEAHLYLACHAAFPIALTPHLLYRLWENFQLDHSGKDWDIPWIAVADLLLAPFCREVGYELYEIDWSIRNELLTILINHPHLGKKRRQELSQFLLTYVQYHTDRSKPGSRNIAEAQRWTALAYLNSEATARSLALALTKLHLEEKTEWVRMASLAETLALPLQDEQFGSLVIYLQGMRDLVRGNPAAAEIKFSALSTHNNRIVVAGVTLAIPEFDASVWKINTVPIPPTPLKKIEVQDAKLIRQPRWLRLGRKWVITRQIKTISLFYEVLGSEEILQMAQIPEGEFEMGSPDKEGAYRERPQHTVKISGFFLSCFPVTQAQWQAIAHKEKVRIDLNPDPSRFKGANLPVEKITWFEAVEFCERLQLQTGRPYRLPSEAEWEYACRAGTQNPFHFGETLSRQVAAYDGSQKYRSGPKGKSSKQTTPVGSFQVCNGFGLSDLHGNVWEWCADHWYEDYNDASADGTPRTLNNRRLHRVIRGGSWINTPDMCRSAYRNGIPPENKILTIGFRVAVSLS